MNHYPNKWVVVLAILLVMFLLGKYGPGHIDPTTLGYMFTALGAALACMLPPREKKKTGVTIYPAAFPKGVAIPPTPSLERLMSEVAASLQPPPLPPVDTTEKKEDAQ